MTLSRCFDTLDIILQLWGSHLFHKLAKHQLQKQDHIAFSHCCATELQLYTERKVILLGLATWIFPLIMAMSKLLKMLTNLIILKSNLHEENENIDFSFCKNESVHR